MTDSAVAPGIELPTRDVGRRSVRRAVINYIKDLIFDGKLRPADRVPQDDIARALSVSNTPVREALIALEHEGLVTIELHRGAFVNPMDRESVKTVYELYGLVFGWAIRRVMTRGMQPETLARLREIAKRTKKANPRTLFDLMTEFTLLLQHETGSREWVRIIDSLQRVVPRSTFYEKVPGAFEGARVAFGPIVEAMDRGDVDAAVSAIEAWNDRQRDSLIEELQRRGLITSPAS